MVGCFKANTSRIGNDMAKSISKPKSSKPAQRQSKLVAPVPSKKSAKVGFATGDKVVHRLFGTGTVLSQRGDILSIQFGKNVTKEILSDFVTPS